jgi:hypothetical protein
MENLPNELLRHIRDYVYRYDWRTCKKREAALVSRMFHTAREAIWLEDEEKYEWTLFGLIFLLNLPHVYHHSLGRPPLIPPRDEFYRSDYMGSYDSVPQYYRKDYIGSYMHRIQWING